MKSHTKIFLLHMWRLKVRHTQKLIVKIVYTLYLTKLNRNKYLTLVPTNGSKEKIKKYEDL